MVTRAPKKKIQNTRSSRLGIRATPDQERVLKGPPKQLIRP